MYIKMTPLGRGRNPGHSRMAAGGGGAEGPGLYNIFKCIPQL